MPEIMAVLPPWSVEVVKVRPAGSSPFGVPGGTDITE